MPNEDTSPDGMARQLRCCVGHDGCFDPKALTSMAKWLEHLKHYNKPVIQHLLDGERPKRAKQNRRKAVIRDLKEDLAVFKSLYSTYGGPGSLKNQIQRYEATIKALEAIENVTWASNFILGTTRPHQPWAIAVRFIGHHVMEVLRSADIAAGFPPREGFNDASVKFIFSHLHRHLKPNETPERRQVIEVLKKIAPTKLSRGRPRRK
jgi:hypothetical protein